ncbi:SCO3242 family prenyltransferase [Catellatospora methionotrophica]
MTAPTAMLTEAQRAAALPAARALRAAQGRRVTARRPREVNLVRSRSFERPASHAADPARGSGTAAPNTGAAPLRGDARGRWAARLRTLAELVRAPAALSVPGDVIAGAAAAGTLDRRTPGLAAASVCLYWAGMAANDWADRELDAVERPERPIPSGRVSPRTALGLAAGLTAVGVGLAAWAGGRRGLATAVPLAATVWAYDVKAKNTAAGPAVMAACRGLDVLLGASTGRAAKAVPAALTVAAHTYTVTALSRREVSGADVKLPVATLAGTVAVAATAAGATRAKGWRAVLPVALAGWYLTHYGRAQARAAASPDAARIRTAVGSGITGLPTLQATLAARTGAGGTGLALAALAPLARRLVRKISAT